MPITIYIRDLYLRASKDVGGPRMSLDEGSRQVDAQRGRGSRVPYAFANRSLQVKEPSIDGGPWLPEKEEEVGQSR